MSERVPEQSLDPCSRLLRTARHPPVLERNDELEPELTLVGIDRPRERHAHVVALGDDDIVPLRAWRLRVEVRGASKREVVLCVLPPNRCVLTHRAQTLQGELADRLEHQVARSLALVTAKQALVQERLDHVWICSANELCRVVACIRRQTRKAREKPSAPPARAGRTTIRSSLGASAGVDPHPDRP